MSAILDKSQMSEEDIKLRFITPALTAKWSVDQSTMETRITDGRINIRGNIAVREKSKKADYVLYLNAHTPIAIVQRASWPEQKIVRGTLKTIVQDIEGKNIDRTAMIVVSRCLGADYELSRLYAPEFSHMFRKAVK